MPMRSFPSFVSLPLLGRAIFLSLLVLVGCVDDESAGWASRASANGSRVDGALVAPPMPVASSLRIASLSPRNVVASPGATVVVTVTLDYAGPPLSDDFTVFLHAVGPSRPDWFDFQLRPLAGPKSSSWQGPVTFTGTLTVPSTAFGNYRLLAGVHDARAEVPPATTANVRLAPADGTVAESFGKGAIGYRYEVGALAVSGAAPPTTPGAGSSSAPAGWAQAVIDDMTKPSEATMAARGAGSMSVYASQGSIGGTGGGFASIVDLCKGTCDHFAENVAGAISWTWIWTGAQNQSTHTRVLARHARGYYLSIRTGQWVKAFDERPVGVPEAIDASTGSGSEANPDTQREVDASTTSLQPNASFKYELWGAKNIGHAAFTDARAWFFSTELSLAPDGSGVDDRSSAQFLVKVGADFYTGEQLPAVDGGNARYVDAATGQLVSGVCGSCYPYTVIDGFGGRYRVIPSDGRWITVTAISLTGAFGGSGYPPPWSDYSVVSPYAQPPYVLTEAEVRANPPPP